MEKKKKRSEDNPIRLRTYLDGCTFIAFMFLAFWGILIAGTLAAFNVIYHAEFAVCTGSIILAAIVFLINRHKS